jgi:hypothetical protein
VTFFQNVKKLKSTHSTEQQQQSGATENVSNVPMSQKIIKRQSHAIFDPRFFLHQSIPLRSLINGLIIFVVEYIRECESIYETTLAHESMDPGVLFDEQTRGRKNSLDCPFK